MSGQPGPRSQSPPLTVSGLGTVGDPGSVRRSRIREETGTGWTESGGNPWETQGVRTDGPGTRTGLTILHIVDRSGGSNLSIGPTLPEGLRPTPA